MASMLTAYDLFSYCSEDSNQTSTNTLCPTSVSFFLSPQRRRHACLCSILLILRCGLLSLTGLVRSSGMFGPTLGFLLGSFCASLWVDIGIADVGKRPWSGVLTENIAVYDSMILYDGCSMILYRSLQGKKHLPSLLLQKGGLQRAFTYLKAGVIYILISAVLQLTGMAPDARPLPPLQKNFALLLMLVHAFVTPLM